MTFRVFIVAITALFLTIGAGGTASAEFSVFYYQDGRPLGSLAEVEALIAETSPVSSEKLDTISMTTSNTNAGHFISTQSAVPLSVQDYFAVYATGQFYVDATDNYTFNTFSDDGFSISIDGAIVSAHDNPRSPSDTTTSNIFLSEGYHTLDLLYYEQAGLAVLEVSYAKGNFASFNPGNFDLLVSSAPEPQIWAFMILGFVCTAFRLKQMKPQLARQHAVRALPSFSR